MLKLHPDQKPYAVRLLTRAKKLLEEIPDVHYAKGICGRLEKADAELQREDKRASATSGERIDVTRYIDEELGEEAYLHDWLDWMDPDLKHLPVFIYHQTVRMARLAWIDRMLEDIS